MGYFICKTKDINNGTVLYAEIKDRYYAEVDNWHFLRINDFTTKEACQKSLENGGYLVNRILTEQEYLVK